MLPSQPIRAARWLPDLYDPDNPGYTLVNNALPHQQGFYSVRGLVPNTGAVGSAPVGSLWGRDSSSSSSPYAVVGGEDGVYFLSPLGVWENQYPVTVDVENWQFVQFKSNVLAVTSGQPVRYANLDNLDHDSDPATGYFQLLGGNPPQAQRVAVIRDFVVLGNTTGAPSRVHWSGFNNAETWEPSGLTQAGYQDLPGHAGIVQAIVPGERGLIFQENAIHRMTQVGPPLLFQFDEIERNRGTQAPNSVCWTSDRVFYYSPVGFFEFRQHGEESLAIGQSKVDRWVLDNVSDTRTMRGVVDPLNKIAAWSINRRSSDYYDHVLVYRWDIEAWSLLAIDHTLLSVYVSPGVNLDSNELNAFYGSTESGAGAPGDHAGASIDNPSAQTSLDSAIWTPGALSLNVFNREFERAGFDGPPEPAIFETGYRPLVPGAERFHLNAIRPLLDRRGALSGGSQTVTVTTKNDLSDPVSEREESVVVPANGRADVRLSGRYASFRLATTGGFAGVSGFLAHSRPKGGRG